MIFFAYLLRRSTRTRAKNDATFMNHSNSSWDEMEMECQYFVVSLTFKVNL